LQKLNKPKERSGLAGLTGPDRYSRLFSDVPLEFSFWMNLERLGRFAKASWTFLGGIFRRLPPRSGFWLGAYDPGQAPDPVAQRIETLRGYAARLFIRLRVAESRYFHAPDGGGESFCAAIVHGNEAEGLGHGVAVRTTPQEFNVCIDAPKYGVKAYLPKRSPGDQLLGNHGAPGQRKAAEDTYKFSIVHRE
jgi:hypothetical protein